MATTVKTQSIGFVIDVPKVFEADIINMTVVSGKVSSQKQFNPASFVNTIITFDIAASIAAGTTKPLADNAAVQVKITIGGEPFQTQNYSAAEVTAALNKKSPLRLALKAYEAPLEESEVEFRAVAFKLKNQDLYQRKLTLSLGYEFTYKGATVYEPAKVIFNNNGEATVNLPLDRQLSNPLLIGISDLLDTDYPIKTINGNAVKDGKSIDKAIIKFNATNEIEVQVAPVKTTPVDPLKQFPARLRGKVIDVAASKKIANAQVLLFVEKEETSDKAFLLTKTNLSGDFSSPYPAINFETPQKIYAIVSERPDKKVYIDLEAYPANATKAQTVYRLPEFIFIVLDNVHDDVNTSSDDSDCGCHKTGSNVERLAEYADLINDDQYTQDIGGSCVNFTKPNRTLSESVFYSVVRTTEPEIVGLDLMMVDDYLKQLESNKASTGIEHYYQGTMKLFATKKVLYQPNTIKLKDRMELSRTNFVDWDETPTFYQAASLAFGHLIEYRQKFYSNGYSLGNILHSEGLAPGQVKKIAVLDWKRTQSSGREESLTFREELEATTDHTQDFEELQSAMLNESMSANSSSKVKATSAAIGGALGGVFPGGIFGIAGGVSHSSSSASSSAEQNSSRNTSARMNSQLADKTKQAAKNVRSQRATVITTDVQSESVGARVEVLANYNHCHAITNVFFEVLRHVAIKQEVTAVSECIFVPLLMTEFTADKIYRWKEHLKSVMLANPVLRRKLGIGFDALERSKYVLKDASGNVIEDGYSNFPAGSYAGEEIQEIWGEFELDLSVSMPVDEYNPSATGNKYTMVESKWTNLIKLGGLLAGGGFSAIRARLENATLAAKTSMFNKDYAPKVAATLLKNLKVYANGTRELPLDFTLATGYTPDKKVKIYVRSEGVAFNNLRRQDINTIKIDVGEFKINNVVIPLSDIGAKMTFKRGKLNYRTKFSSGSLFNSASIENDLGINDPVFIYTPCSTEELKSPRKEDRKALENLVRVCNENLETLHASIWRSMSEQKIFFLLDGIKIPAQVNGKPVPASIVGKSVASIVDAKSLGVVGNSLVFRITDGVNADPVYRQVNMDADDPEKEKQAILKAGQIPVEDLLEMYQPLTPVEPYQLSFPTGGYFMETIMGACNSCEKIDDSRFWKWEEHPIPITPSEIAPVSLDSRYQQPLDTKPTEFPASNISIQNIPQGPQPTGLGASLDLLGKSNLFKDITGLEGTQTLASKGLDVTADTLKAAMSNAVSAMNSAAAYDLAKGQQKSDNFDKLMKSNLPPDIKQDMAEKFAKDGLLGEEGSGMMEAYKKTIDQIGKEIAKGNPNVAETFGKVTESLKGNAEEISVKGPDGTEVSAKGVELDNDKSIQWVIDHSEDLLKYAKAADLVQDSEHSNACWAYALATMLYPDYNWEDVGDSNATIMEKILEMANNNNQGN